MFPIADLNDDAAVSPPALSKLMPRAEDIPIEYTRWETPYTKLANEWFFCGLCKKSVFLPRPGVDVAKAQQHIQFVLRSYLPDHHYKISAVAFLLHEWFSDVRIR